MADNAVSTGNRERGRGGWADSGRLVTCWQTAEGWLLAGWQREVGYLLADSGRLVTCWLTAGGWLLAGRLAVIG